MFKSISADQDERQPCFFVDQKNFLPIVDWPLFRALVKMDVLPVIF
jgi:hypothetical protein